MDDIRELDFSIIVPELGDLRLRCHARVCVPPAGHWHPGDPSNDGEVLELDAVRERDGHPPVEDEALYLEEIKIQRSTGWMTLWEILAERAWEEATS